MIPTWNSLDANDRDRFAAAAAFLKDRLAEFDTIEWALGLEPDRQVERVAIERALSKLGAGGLAEPWAGAWRLIIESWADGVSQHESNMAVYEVRNKLRAGDRSGPVISAIVDLVRPRLEVQSPNSPTWDDFVTRPHRPKKIGDLLSARLTSGRLVDLRVLKLRDVREVPFLLALVNELEAAVSYGLSLAGRIGWDGRGHFLSLGGLNWAGYSSTEIGLGRNRQSDDLSRGIAPAVKLLQTVVVRVAELDQLSAQSTLQSWRIASSPVHSRLWAVTALDRELVNPEEVGAFLVGLNDREFWRVEDFPEVAQLRASRFADLDATMRQLNEGRLRKKPPRELWPKRLDAKLIESARVSWAARELKRIEVAGGALSAGTHQWLSERMEKMPELAEMLAEDGFPKGPVVRAVLPNPDEKFDVLEGTERLVALEGALSSGEFGWMASASTRANDWLNLAGKSALVLHDLEATKNGGDAFPAVWNRLGWAHRPGDPEVGGISQEFQQDHAERTLGTLEKVSRKTLAQAIEGISAWLLAWRHYVVELPQGLRLWLRVWPIAAEATNLERRTQDVPVLKVSDDDPNHDQESSELDTLNNPAGKLVHVFLEACPDLTDVPEPFSAGSLPRQMRDAMIGSEGEARLIVLHRLIEALPYFLSADENWTLDHLVAPLETNNFESLVLWDAVARQTHFARVLKIIGKTMPDRVVDSRVRRETRRKLAFSLVVESLHAIRECREPVVSNSTIQQMLRSADDEVRAGAAEIPKLFVEDMSRRSRDGEEALTPQAVFRSAAKPFLESVWPQERSLATRGVSRALASLPAASGEAFGEAVHAIERFLVPFEGLSMLDYGFDDYEGNKRSFSVINDETKAQALLQLLDHTVSASTSAVVPSDLSEALGQVRNVAPELAKSRVFRRLATAARR